MARLYAAPAWSAVAALVVASALVRFVAALAVPGPWVAPDEMVYGLLGRSLYEEGRLDVLDGPTPFVSLVYPALVGLPLALGGLEDGYVALKALQALLMSATAIPVYAWAREAGAGRWALLAAALAVAVPGLAYSGLLMTEVAFYPVATLALWTAARALAEPTPRRQAVAAVAVGLAVATRLQAVVLLPAFVTALLLKATLDRSTAVLRAFAPTLAAAAALTAGAVGVAAADGRWSDVLGIYAVAGETSYAAGDAFRWVVYHAGAAVLTVALFPVVALGVLLALALRRRETDPRLSALLALSGAYALWLVAEVGVFASRHILRLAERDLLTLAPPLFVVFAAWLGHGAPRPRAAVFVAAVGAAGLVMTLPGRLLVQPETFPDALTLAPLHHLSLRAPDLDVSTVVALSAGGAAAALALLPRRLAPLLGVLALVALAGASVVASSEIASRSRAFVAEALGADEQWIDRAGTGPVAYVYDGDPYWNAVWAHAYWNRRVASVVSLPAARVPGPMPQTRVRRLPDGRLIADGRAPDAPYAVTTAQVALVGTPLQTATPSRAGQGALTLWRVSPPLRVAYTRTGVQVNGDMHGPARLTVYGCGRGTLELTLLAKASRRAEIRRNGELHTVVRFAGPDDTWSASIPAPAGADGTGTCTFDVAGDAFLGSTRFAFVRTG